MKLAILGEASQTWLVLIKQALAAGHQVTALGDPALSALSARGVVIVPGDATVAADVEKVVAGQDAILSLLAPGRSLPWGVVCAGTRHILEAMKKHGVRRLVCASAAGIPMPQDQHSPFAVALDKTIRLLLRSEYEDRAQQITLLQQSNTDWVAIRVSRLTDEPQTHGYQLGYPEIGSNLAVSREDLAACLLAQVTDNTWLRQAPIICYEEECLGNNGHSEKNPSDRALAGLP
jgi:putative NADH-flavin reductase